MDVFLKFAGRAIKLRPLGLVCCVFVLGCSLRIMPIQVARVVQTESYSQRFTFFESPDCNAEMANPECQVAMSDAFNRLLGPRNWQIISSDFGTPELLREFREGSIRIRGMLDIAMYLDPYNHDLFILEGSGQFYLIRETTQAILLGGDFQVISDLHAITELDSGYVFAEVELFITRIGGRDTTYADNADRSPLVYEIQVDNSMREDRIYAIDYVAEHNIYLPKRRDGQLTPDDVIGKMMFANSGRTTKLIDLRGRRYLRDDYQDRTRDTEAVRTRRWTVKQ